LNAEIASALVVAEPTVGIRASNLLGLRDRAHAVMHASQHRLVAPGA
jgi:DNA-binding NarL/FixJ family response regulator